MQTGNSKREGAVKKTVASVTWPLLLSEKERDFVESFSMRYREVTFVHKPSQYSWQYKKNEGGVLIEENLHISLFGHTLAGPSFLTLLEKPLLYRVIQIRKIIDKPSLHSTFQHFELRQASELYFLVAAYLSFRNAIVTTEMIRDEVKLYINEHPDRVECGALYLFLQYFLGTRQEKIFFLSAEDSAALSLGKEVFTESLHPILQASFFLRE